MKKKYLGFEFAGGHNTTIGTPNVTTGYYSISGTIHLFLENKDRHAWVKAGKVTKAMGANCRVALTELDARALCKGQTIKEFEHDMNKLYDDAIQKLGEK